MGNPFKKVQPGERLEIPAETFNTFVDAALDFKNRQRTVGQDTESRLPTSTILKVENASGADCARFGVLGIAAPILRPDENLAAFQAEPALCGSTPRTQCHVGRFAILLEPVAAGAIGRGVVAGVTVARVEMADASHRTAEIADRRSDALVSRADGGSAAILWVEPGTGVRWAIVRIGDGAAATTTTGAPGATATTPAPGSQACQGGCKYIWSQESKTWSLDEDNCGAPTTTTTEDPGTTTSTTATTPEPCPCGCCPETTTTTGDPSSTTTQTTSSTTTTPAPCRCAKPTYCGEEDGECTVTDCIDSAFEPADPDCGQTSTTTTTTTTTGDPSSTTTPDPAFTTTSTTCPPTTATTTTKNPCADGCDWKWAHSPGSASWHWVLTVNGCSSACPCPTPEDLGGFACAETHTPCATTPAPPDTTSPPGCSGFCDWYWGFGGTAWVQTYHGCETGQAVPCDCPRPSREGNACGDWARTQCIAGATTTTITTVDPCAPTTTATTGDPSSTTTETTSSTTTTPGPCKGDCKWQWSTGSSSWSAIRNDCEAECPCQEPYYDGAADCETAITACRHDPPTTTITGDPTTTTSTTTTTPCAWDAECATAGSGEECECVWHCCCNESGTGVGWYLAWYGCEPHGVTGSGACGAGPSGGCSSVTDIGSAWSSECATCQTTTTEAPSTTTGSPTTTEAPTTTGSPTTTTDSPTTTTGGPTTTTTCYPESQCYDAGGINCNCYYRCCCEGGGWTWVMVQSCQSGTCISGDPGSQPCGYENAGEVITGSCEPCPSTTTTGGSTSTSTTGGPTSTTGGPTSTTGGPTSTTGGPTSTSTTGGPSCAGYTCSYVCNAGGDSWSLMYSDCPNGCACIDLPPTPCTPDQGANINCQGE